MANLMSLFERISATDDESAKVTHFRIDSLTVITINLVFWWSLEIHFFPT